MEHHPLSSPGPSIEDRVRGLQIHRTEQNLVGCLLGVLVGTVLTCTLFWKDWAFVLLPWAAVLFLVCGLRLYRALRISMRPPQALHARTVRTHAILDVVMWIAITLGPVWIMFHSEGLTALYMVLFSVSIFWGGALAYIFVFPVAASFSAVQLAIWIAVAASMGWNSGYEGMVVLFCLVGAVEIAVARQLSAGLGNGLRQQLRSEIQALELKRQTETIGLLLKEHEDESSDWLWHLDASMTVHEVSLRFASALGRAAGDLEGLSFVQALSAHDVEGNADACRSLQGHMEAQRSFRDLIVPGAVGGGARWWSVSGRPTFEGEKRLTGYRGVMTDVTKEQRARAEVIHLAHYDTLTDLPNRLSFLQRLETSLRQLDAGRLAVIYIDLDGFKLVNDSHGHAVGDALLVAVAGRLQDATTNNDLVARLSGDEFVIKTRITDHDALEVLCKRLLKDLSQPFPIGALDIRVGASFGIAFAPTDGTTADALLKNADAALYRAKHGGRGTYRFFAADLDRKMQERADLLGELRDAGPRGELILHYQPFVDAGTGAVTGYEALIRWLHPDRGLVPPLDFVPLAEESGLIVPIGAWVIRTACAEAATWSNDRRVSVNISPVQFHDCGLPDVILAALVETGLPPHRLEIELTESIFVSDIDQALGMLRRIRGLGVRVALDDFGTGYSSLSYLRSFPFDKIKIDRSFVQDLSTRLDSQVIVRAVGDIARGLNMTVTAEGVETLEQANLLQLAGCHELQGYLYGRPKLAEGRTALIEQAASIADSASVRRAGEAK